MMSANAFTISFLALGYLLGAVPTAMAQETTATPHTTIAIQVGATNTTSAPVKCGTDVACIASEAEAAGFNPAAATFLATASYPSDVASGLYNIQITALPTVTLTDAPGLVEYVANHESLLPSSVRADYAPILSEVVSLQTATSAAAGNDSVQPSVSHGAAARPTDVALMAMAGVVAGVAGLAMGL